MVAIMPPAAPAEVGTAHKRRIRSPVVHLMRNAGESRPRAAHARTQTKSAQQVGEFAATIESSFARQR